MPILYKFHHIVWRASWTLASLTWMIRKKILFYETGTCFNLFSDTAICKKKVNFKEKLAGSDFSIHNFYAIDRFGSSQPP